MIELLHGNSLDVLAGLPDASVHAVITDPPYALTDLPTAKVTEALTHWVSGDRAWVPGSGKGFMGRSWDNFVPPPALWDEVLRVLRPGGLALVFAGARTFDLMGMSCRLAGFDVRDSVAWISAQSMPKTSDLGKFTGDSTWQGWSTGLKSANEPFLVLRKPFAGPMKSHIGHHATGAYNIDSTRVRSTPGELVGRWPPNVVFSHHPACAQTGIRAVRSNSHHPASRPAGGISVNGHSGQTELEERRPVVEMVPDNDCHPDCPVRLLDEQSGVLTSGSNPTKRNGSPFTNLYGTFVGDGTSTFHRGADTGGASRFFPAFRYCAKAPKVERPVVDGEVFPTVKPLELMRWMVRLVGVPGGLIVDPFAGSGTTGEACLTEGFDCLLIEREADHLPFIEQRLGRVLHAS